MPVCQVYVLAHIVLGEYLLSRMNGVPVREHFYSRTAQMYQAINRLLTDPETTTGRKLWTFIQAAMVEHTVRRIDLQQLHVRALDALVESHGGLIKFTETATDDVFLQVSSRLYANQFARTAVPPTDRYQLRAIVARFTLCLTSINAWMCSLRSNSIPQSRTRRPDLLLAYLDEIAHRGVNAGALFCPLSICLTLVGSSSTIENTLQFLLRIEELMFNTTTVKPKTSRELNNLHPVAAAYTICCVRSELFPEIREFCVSETLVDAHKIFALLGEESKMEILRWLVDCVYILSVLQSHTQSVWCMYTDFGSEKLSILEKEIEAAWERLSESSFRKQ